MFLFYQICHYRPQRSCEGYVFTGVCLSMGGGVPDQVPPEEQTPARTRYTPRARYTPLEQTPPKTRYTPRDQVHPLEQTPPGPGTPPNQVHPRARYTPLEQTPPGPGTPPRPGTPTRPGSPTWDQVHHPPLGPGTPPRDTSTAADGTHPTGMHSCFSFIMTRYVLTSGCVVGSVFQSRHK